MTLYEQLQIIRDEHFHNLRNEREQQFIEDMCEGLDGVPKDIIDEDVTEYLTERQIEWIRDIWCSVS